MPFGIEQDPPAGLASIEAIYVAQRVFGFRDESLLDGYHWRDEFLTLLEGVEIDGGPGATPTLENGPENEPGSRDRA